MFDFEHDGADDIGLSIQRAVDSAHKKMNLYHYDVVVMPERRTKINQYMLRYIYRFNQPQLCSVEDILLKPMDEELCSMIRQQNVLIIDDVTTSGSISTRFCVRSVFSTKITKSPSLASLVAMT